LAYFWFVEMLELLIYPRNVGCGYVFLFAGNLLPKAGDGVEVALPVSNLTFALGQPIEFVHIAIGGTPQIGAVTAKLPKILSYLKG